MRGSANRWWGLGAAAALASLVVAVPARAAAPTRCSFGGSAGTSRIIQLDLPQASFVNLSLAGNRSQPSLGTTASWHLAMGVVVLDEQGALEAARVSNTSGPPRRVIVEGAIDQGVAGPDVPLARDALVLPPELPAGTHYVAAFGSDGDPAAPNNSWSGFVEVDAGATCIPLGSGRLLDVSHADFSGGMQVSAPGVAMVDGAGYQADFTEDRVVGLIDASSHAGGSTEVDYAHPDRSGTVSNALEAYSSRGGSFSWTARMVGVAPLASVVALAFELPQVP